MSLEDLAARNRRNAQKSTGPTTSAGKATVAQNARQHGATAKPDPASVAAWLRVILDAPDLTPNDLLNDDRRMIAALTLAEAEVRLVSAKAALDKFEHGEAELTDVAQELQDFAEDISKEIQAGTMIAKERRSGLSLLSRIEREVYKDVAFDGKRHRLLKRYLREARAHRRRAFEVWLACLREEMQGVRVAA